MAKRTRAPARRGSARSRKPAKESAIKTENKSTSEPKRQLAVAQTRQAVLARRRIFTTECLAYMRQRFEQSADSLADIGVRVGIPAASVSLVAIRERWKRYVRPPHELPPAVKLSMQTEVRDQQVEEQSRAPAENAETGPQVGGEEHIPLLADTVARLHRAVLDELAVIETLRTRSPGAGSSARTARTLASLTETLQKLRRLQPDPANSGSHDDDMPADIDEFRNELARRIEAFVRERTDTDAARGSVAPAAADPV
jgi:hypothetical protein